jgi:hypothetical protein
MRFSYRLEAMFDREALHARSDTQQGNDEYDAHHRTEIMN